MPVNPALYNGVIPQSGDFLSISQGQILNNFGAIQSLIDTDHVDFSSGTAVAGQHDRISFTVQTSPPAQNLPNRANWVAGQVGLYSSLNATTNKNELYINKTNNSGIVQIPGTASILGTSNPTPGAFGNATGWTMLPSGIKMVWGTFTGSGASQTITLVGAQQFATTILSVQLTVIGNSTTAVQALARVRVIAANSFDAVVSDVTGSTFSTANVMFLAIGY